jgi:hypothetical protein
VIDACELMSQVMRRRLARYAELSAAIEGKADAGSAIPS